MSKLNATSYSRDKIKVLFLENLSPSAIHQFKDAQYSNIVSLPQAMSEDELISIIKDVHILGIRSKTIVSKKVLNAAKKLQAIGCFCIGTNQVDLEAATQKGIAVFNAPYSNTRSVAELVIGASIMLIRKIPEKNKSAHEGIWSKDAKGSRELRGKTMGIVGYGNIGSQISILAEAVGMSVCYYDVNTKMPLGNAVSKKSLKELLQVADIISLHVPELESTKNLINKNNIKYFKKGAILINYARGEVVDQVALSKQIINKEMGGAAIDVFPIEPEKNGASFSSPLQGLKNVLLTPHIGGSTEEAQVNIGLDVSAKLFNFLEYGLSEDSKSIPELRLPPQENTHRILHIHNNVPGVLSAINNTLATHKVNILGQYLKTNEKIGYVVLDIEKSNISRQVAQLLKTVDETIRVRLLY